MIRERQILGKYIQEYSVRNKSAEALPVYSVTNDKGFCQGYFDKDVSSKDKSGYKIVPRGYFAYNPSRINVGSIACQEAEDRVIVSPLYVVFGASGELYNPYLMYFLKSPYANAYINAYARGAVRNNFSIKKMCDLTLPVPSLEGQQSIVKELDAIHAILDAKNEQLRELDNLAQAIFYDMFGDPITNEKGWEVKKIGEIATFYNGKAHEQYIDEAGKYILINSKFISSDATIVKRTNKQIFPLFTNDIVMVMSDVPNGRAIAKCYIVEKDETYSLNQRICAFRDYKEVPIFLYYILNRNPYYLSFDDGDSQTNLRKEDVLACPIPLPPLDLQQAFAKKIEAIEAQKELIRQSEKETEALLAARMQYYFE